MIIGEKSLSKSQYVTLGINHNLSEKPLLGQLHDYAWRCRGNLESSIIAENQNVCGAD